MIPLTEQQLQAVADWILTWVETRENVLEKDVTEQVRRTIDQYGIPALYAYLQQHGVVAVPTVKE